MYQAPIQSIPTSQTLPNESMQKVEIFLSARNLLDMDFFSKSDPYIKVYFTTGPQKKRFYMGKTETIDNNLNPNFVKSFTLDYIFEVKQELFFEVFDEDDGKNDDFIGSVTTTLGAVAGAKNQTLFLDLQNNKGKKPGKLIVRLEPCTESNLYYQMGWRAKKLLNTDSFFDFWDKSDPYLKFLKIRSDNSLVEAGRTNTVMDNLNPKWNPIELGGSRLFSTDNSTGKFKVQCWDWEKEGEAKHQFIGELYLEVSKLKQIQTFPVEFPLVNRKEKKPGKLILDHFREILKPSFVDYLRGGLELNLTIAIDFTGSNGMPNHTSSLHYINPNMPNQYQNAIHAVSRILLAYDSDQRIPAFGFGGKPQYPNFTSPVVSHCFPLSGNPQEFEAFGLQHLMELYNRALVSVQFSGPTYFSPILQEAVRIARMNAQEGSNTYQVVLILTDGEIHDMEQTIDLLVANCNLPLSIIIVGVGNAEFTNMVRLDGDNGLYSSKGQKAQRDMVQFVPFREVGMNPDLLAQQLLAELPTQVTQYMNMIGKPPGKPMQINIDEQMMQQGQPIVQPQQAMQAQVTNMFQEANFFEGF